MTIQLASVLTPLSDIHLQLAAQCGVSEIVHRYPQDSLENLRESKKRIESYGMRLSVVEGYLPIERIKLGIDDGSDLAAMKSLIRVMGDLGIGTLCYNFMTGTDWVRTRTDALERGGARVTSFSLKEVENAIRLGYRVKDASTEEIACRQTAESLWGNLQGMLDELLPLAESCRVTLTIHPDDPPLSNLLGKTRIMNSVESFERLMRSHASPFHGLCFCQGTFATMGVDIPKTILRLGQHIRYVHFRDVRGNSEEFTETFHDNGATDMVEAMRAYRTIGYSGTMRPDHVPQLVGEEDGEPGYTMLGRLFAFGYIRGLIQATESRNP